MSVKPKIWVTSDTHFNHINILRYEPESRPFDTVEEMNEVLIANWNSVVGEDDIVYHLGDFFMGKLDEIAAILSRLNGHIILIRGNHDSANRIELYKEHGVIIKDIDFITYKGRYFIMCHFPIANDEFIKMVRQDNSEVVDLYGHVHSNTPKGFHDGMYHVGVDTNNLTPISLEQIWNECWHETMSNAEKAYREEHKNDAPEFLTMADRGYCDKCVWYPNSCWGPRKSDGNCPDNYKYKRDPPDGGYYG